MTMGCHPKEVFLAGPTGRTRWRDSSSTPAWEHLGRESGEGGVNHMAEEQEVLGHFA